MYLYYLVDSNAGREHSISERRDYLLGLKTEFLMKVTL
jgi:hypothetical protein